MRISREPAGDYPSASRGNAVFLDALDVNWGARMSEVRVTGSLSCAELHEVRSNRGSTGSVALQAIFIDRESPLSRIGYQCAQFESGPETVRDAAVAVSSPSADIFEELTTVFAQARSSSRMTAPRFSASAGLHPADLFARDKNLRCSNSCERGLKICQ
jgi:hypothetical protein